MLLEVAEVGEVVAEFHPARLMAEVAAVAADLRLATKDLAHQVKAMMVQSEAMG
jgi:hypothetical protein